MTNLEYTFVPQRKLIGYCMSILLFTNIMILSGCAIFQAEPSPVELAEQGLLDANEQTRLSTVKTIIKEELQVDLKLLQSVSSNDDSYIVRRLALGAVTDRISPDAAEALLVQTIQTDPNERIRIAALYLVPRRGPNINLNLLKTVAKEDTSPRVRQSAIDIVINRLMFKQGAAKQYLAKVISTDSDPDVKKYAKIKLEEYEKNIEWLHKK